MHTVTETATGRLQGVIVEGSIKAFRGVPFARPPVGALRFAPPQPAEPWSGIRSADTFGPVSLQGTIGLGFMGAGAQTQGEDCLYLNVWTPDLGGRRPVMVWVHGGAFLLGAGSEPLYDGSQLASRGDVVVVTVNYRLGALGYLAHPALRDDATGACGNWGLLDQIAAIEWVRDNAEAFGGDPSQITVFGESAGSMSVTTIMAAPRARGLFRRAIAQSGAPVVATAEEAAATAERVIDALGVRHDQLREVPAKRFLDVQQQIMLADQRPGGSLSGDVMAFRPTVDGAVLPRDPRVVFADGEAAGIELMIGTNRDEMKLFSLFDQEDLDEAGLLGRVGAHLDGDAAQRVTDAYRSAADRPGRGGRAQGTVERHGDRPVLSGSLHGPGGAARSDRIPDLRLPVLLAVANVDAGRSSRDRAAVRFRHPRCSDDRAVRRQRARGRATLRDRAGGLERVRPHR